jgi:hypothetical protein
MNLGRRCIIFRPSPVSKAMTYSGNQGPEMKFDVKLRLGQSSDKHYTLSRQRAKAYVLGESRQVTSSCRCSNSANHFSKDW